MRRPSSFVPSSATWLLLATACSSPARSSPPPPGFDTGIFADALTDTADAGDSIPVGDASDVGDAEAEPPPKPVCDPTWAWGTVDATPTLSTGESMTLGSITPDELVMSWLVVGPTTMGFVAERASASEAFGVPQPLPIDPRAQGLALSADGLRVVFVNRSGGLEQVVRAKRGDPFDGDPSLGGGTLPFSSINGKASEGGLVVSRPVLSSDDQRLYFNLASPDGYAVRVAEKSGTGRWTGGSPLLFDDFKSDGDKRRLPTGVSSDDLSLFYWDEVSSEERVATRATKTGAFTSSRSIGARFLAAPSSDCKRLYFSGPSSPYDVLVAH